MLRVAETDALRILEVGYAQHPIDRALTILACVSPDLSREALADLPLGERDRRLFRIREYTFGPVMRGFSECMSCPEKLEYELRIAEILAQATPDASYQATWEMEHSGYRVRCRLPTSRDLAAAVLAPDAVSAERMLRQRCMAVVARDTHALDEAALDDLPDIVGNAIDDDFAAESRARDPLTEITIDLVCPSCGQHARVLVDIGAFLWEELVGMGRQLLHAVDVLARTYHWSEVEILSMSQQRRRWYLEMTS
jgi:hypothetical protein